MALTLVTSDLIHGLDYSKLTGTIPTWNQNTTGNADTATLAAGATILATARNIGGVSFNGSAAINLPGVNAAGNQPTSGTAAGLSATLVVGSGGTGVTSITSLKNVLDDETWTFANKITSDAGIDIDNFNIDGNTISLSSGNMVIGTASAASALTISDYGLLTMTAGSSSNPRLIFAGADVSGAHFIQINRGESSMQFYVNGDYRATISSSGNVGIGTTSPAGRLELQGSGQSWTTSPAIRMWDSFNSKGWLVGSANNITAGDFYIITLPSIDGYPSSGEQEFTIKHATGNVGIGTTSPEQKLHVEGTIQLGNTEQLGWAYDDGSYYNYITNSYNSNDGLTYRSGSWTSNSSIICHSFETYVGDWQKRLVIRQDGNVGIGTTSPTSKLEVIVTQSDTMTDDTAAFAIKGNGGDGLLMGQRSTSPYAAWIAAGYLQNIGTSHNYPLALQPHGGNVGIGTTSPSALLEIQTVGTTGNEDFQIFSRGVSPNYEVLKISRSAGSANLLANQNLTLSADYDNNHGSTDSNIYFKTNDDTKLTIASGGLATFSNGIQFGTGATLDAYEEGTWTPSLKFGGANTGMSYAGVAGTSSRGGHYTKIGRVVTYSMRIILANKGTATGSATIEGLPYIVANLPGNYGSAMYSYANNFIIPERASITIDNNSSIIRLRYTRTNSISADVNNSDFLGNTTIILVGTYLSI